MSSEWPRTTFDQLCDIKRGASPRPIHDWLAPTGIPWVKISDATASSSPFITKTAEFIRPEGANKSVEVFPGDFILSNSATPGIPKFMQIHACVHDGWMLLRNFRGLDQWYCYYLLQTERENLIRQGNGSVFTNLKTEILKKHEVVVPPMKYQREVATFLRTLDDRITLLRETNSTLEAIAQALFKSWFVDFDPVRAKMEGRAPEGMDEASAALFPDSLEGTVLGGVPSGWRVQALDEIASYLNGLALQKFPPTGHDDLPVIKIAQLRKGDSVGSDMASRSIKPEYVIQNGDVLFSWSGSLEVEFWCGGEGALNQHLFKVTSSKYPKWFYYFWTRYHLEDFRHVAASKATTMGHIQRNHLSAAKVFVPTDNILLAANDVLQPIVERLIENALQAQTLSTIRDTLLPRLISGQLSLSDATQFRESVVI